MSTPCGSPPSTQPLAADCGQQVLSQEEIFEEIVMECSEIELRIVAPSSDEYSAFSSPSAYDSASPQDDGRRMRKREKKKAQNRAAASRYREKKRLEKSANSALITKLLLKNEELTKEVEDVRKEIVLLKKLMKDIGIIQN